MEPGKGSGPIGLMEPLIRDCEETARVFHLETPPTSESCDVALPEPQPTRTLKWSALKLFGGRRSICTLPSLFRSRKSHGKGLLKISKSKTHDGISKVSWEDGRRAGDIPARDFEYHSQKDSALANRQSSQVVNEISEGGESSCLPKSNGNHKPFWDKSLHFRRPKKGLKGFFSSLRRPKKNRNVELENQEAFELSGEITDHVVRAAVSSTDIDDDKSLSCSAECKSPVSSVKDLLTVSCKVLEEAIVSENGIGTDQDSLKSQTGIDIAVDLAADALNVGIEGEALCRNAELASAPLIGLDHTERGQLSVQSSDQISVILGDDTSLKSFDSLTGCGDVIADQDDDSIADSTVSGEKSRSAGKRNSCYVNYQGGGEEMATPDEVDKADYFRGLWEGDTEADMDGISREKPGFVMQDVSLMVTTKAQPSLSPQFDAGGNFNSLQPGTCATSAPLNVLTPQSDQQGSLPNSDEGYYDSTTPGPDDDRGDDIVGIANERLPRDSYSGDALYELYESEDPLTSPPPDIKPSFDTNTQPPTQDPLSFLCLTSASLEEERPTSSAVEEARLAKVQQGLLHCGQQGAKNSTAKEQAEFRFCLKKSTNECIPRLNKKQHCLNDEQQGVSWTPSSKGECVLYESRCLKDRNINGQSVPSSQKTTDNHLHDTKEEDIGCTATALTSAIPVKDLNSYKDQSQQRDLSEDHGKMLSSKKVEKIAEHGQAVCFSQALMDFTKNTKLFSNLSCGLVGPEPGNSFSQNVEALPAMVTFDVFDTENEGECDRSTEMDLEMDIEVTDEDVESPYDTSPYESYLQKDAFAECDDRMLNDFDRSLFYSNTWGVASLPRYYGLAGISLPVPAPLSTKRRSRSLDTDTLEFEIGDLCLTENIAKPLLISFPKSEHCFSSVSPRNHRLNANVANPEMQGRAVPAASWQLEILGSSVPPQTDEKRVSWLKIDFEREGTKLPNCHGERQQPRPIGQATKGKIRPPITKCTSKEKWGCNSTRQSPGQMVRSSHLPVQSGPHPSQPDPSLSGTPGECEYGDPVQVAALEDRKQAHLSQKYFANQLQDCTLVLPKIRPVGVTRGMPHCRPDTNRTSKLANCKKQREITSKERDDLSVSQPVGCHKHV